MISRNELSGSPIVNMRYVFIASMLLPLVVFGIGALYVHFQVGLNDFWDIQYYARNIDWHKRESLYNGFFPIGYPLLIKLFSLKYVVIASHLLNVFFAALLVSATVALVASR